MANDNEGGRAFLAIVLGGIVLALVIAAFVMYGHKGETDVKVQQPAAEQPAEAPPALPAAEQPAEVPPAPPAAEAPAMQPAAPAEEESSEPSEPPAEEEPAPDAGPAPGESPAPQNP